MLSPDVLCPDCPGGCVARVIVDVMLKPEIHDPQGEAVLSASHRLGFGNVSGVRQGKRFELEIDGPAENQLYPPQGHNRTCGSVSFSSERPRASRRCAGSSGTRCAGSASARTP